MERLPDMIENMEAAAERWADENVKGDKFRCDCGKWVPLDEGETMSANPYARPVCRNCAKSCNST